MSTLHVLGPRAPAWSMAAISSVVNSIMGDQRRWHERTSQGKNYTKIACFEIAFQALLFGACAAWEVDEMEQIKGGRANIPEDDGTLRFVPSQKNLVVGCASACWNISQRFLERSTGLLRDRARKWLVCWVSGDRGEDVHKGTVCLNSNALALATFKDR